jgi:hypothetical protein
MTLWCNISCVGLSQNLYLRYWPIGKSRIVSVCQSLQRLPVPFEVHHRYETQFGTEGNDVVMIQEHLQIALAECKIQDFCECFQHCHSCCAHGIRSWENYFKGNSMLYRVNAVIAGKKDFLEIWLHHIHDVITRRPQYELGQWYGISPIHGCNTAWLPHKNNMKSVILYSFHITLRNLFINFSTGIKRFN